MARLWKVFIYTKELRLYSIANKDPWKILAQRSDIGEVVSETSQKTTATVQVGNSEV